ncbi:hypothetical protein D3C81_288510 [compost metagenome]
MRLGCAIAYCRLHRSPRRRVGRSGRRRMPRRRSPKRIGAASKVAERRKLAFAGEGRRGPFRSRPCQFLCNRIRCLCTSHRGRLDYQGHAGAAGVSALWIVTTGLGVLKCQSSLRALRPTGPDVNTRQVSGSDRHGVSGERGRQRQSFNHGGRQTPGEHLWCCIACDQRLRQRCPRSG